MIKDKNIKPNTLVEGSTTSNLDLMQLQTQIQDMQMKIDILKETIDVLKEAPTSTGQLLKTGRSQLLLMS